MRDIPAPIAAAIASGATTFCRCWLLTRKDGVALGFTDHDRDLTIDATIFEAASGLDRSALEAAEGLASTGGEVSGALTSARITPEDIALGRYDGAELRCWLVDWSAPALSLLLEVNTLGEIRQTDGRFTVELANPLAKLDAEQGRRYTRDCSAEPGDAACGVDLDASAFRCTGNVTSIAGDASLVVAAAASFVAGHFTGGRLRFTSGQNAGLVLAIREHRGDGSILFWQPLARQSLPGDGVVLTAGCDKSLATCRTKFANALNFRGFPYLPQPEFVIAYAEPGAGRQQGRPLIV